MSEVVAVCGSRSRDRGRRGLEGGKIVVVVGAVWMHQVESGRASRGHAVKSRTVGDNERRLPLRIKSL